MGMVLVCLSADRGEYRIDDAWNRTAFGPFFTAASPQNLAQQLADLHRVTVHLLICEESRTEQQVYEPRARLRLVHST